MTRLGLEHMTAHSWSNRSITELELMMYKLGLQIISLQKSNNSPWLFPDYLQQQPHLTPEKQNYFVIFSCNYYEIPTYKIIY